MTTDLLSQLTAVIADAERSAVEAELWRETRRLMQEVGYGPRITPAQIVALIPNVHGINEILAATQEVAPPQTHRGGRAGHHGPLARRQPPGANRRRPRHRATGGQPLPRHP
jgi:hypothetical protein